MNSHWYKTEIYSTVLNSLFSTQMPSPVILELQGLDFRKSQTCMYMACLVLSWAKPSSESRKREALQWTLQWTLQWALQWITEEGVIGGRHPLRSQDKAIELASRQPPEQLENYCWLPGIDFIIIISWWMCICSAPHQAPASMSWTCVHQNEGKLATHEARTLGALLYP